MNIDNKFFAITIKQLNYIGTPSYAFFLSDYTKKI